MTEIIGVRFQNSGKAYYFDPGGLQVAPGESVIVETAKGLEIGRCTQGNTVVEDAEVVQPLRAVVRVATEEDKQMQADNKGKERWAAEVFQKKIQEHQLDMKLVNVQYNFDGSKILFFFTADGRVDFRELVKDLASVFRTRIELRQIGVRDEAKMLGGLGVCGQPFCCNRFLDEFQPVSIKMAKTQNLSLNPTKISGTCGRLMCCLKYEQEAYEDLVKRAPKLESFVETEDGVGTVSAVNLLREQAKVRLDIAPESPRDYKFGAIKVVRSGKGKRPEGYDTPEALQAEHLRKIMEQERENRRMTEAPSPQEQPSEQGTQKQGGQKGQHHRDKRGSGRAKAQDKDHREGAKPKKNASDSGRETKEPRSSRQQKEHRPAHKQSQRPAGEKAKRDEGGTPKSRERRRYPQNRQGKAGQRQNQNQRPKGERPTGTNRDGTNPNNA